jgi:MFS family permease
MFTLTINMIVLSIFQPFTGWITDRFGPKRVLAFGIAVLGLVTLALSNATHLWQFYLYYGVIGAIGLAAVSPVNVTSLVSGWFVERNRGAALSISTSGSAFGQLMIVPAATWLLTMTSWPNLYRILSLLLLIAVLPMTVLLVRSAPDAANQRRTAANDRGSATLGSALAGSAFWLLAFGFFTCGFTMAFANAHFMAYADDMGMRTTTAADIVAATALFSIAGSFALGMLADRRPRHHVLALTYALRGAAFLLLWLFHSGPLLFVYAIVLGVSWTATTPITAAISADLYGRARIGIIFGTMFSFMNIGFGAGSFLDGLAYDTFGNYRAALLANVAMGALASLAALRVAGGPARVIEERSPIEGTMATASAAD